MDSSMERTTGAQQPRALFLLDSQPLQNLHQPPLGRQDRPA
jgi:hypothetical protein